MSNKFAAMKARSRRNVKSSPKKQSRPQRQRSIETSSNTSSLTAFELKKEITSKQLQNDQICAVTVSKNLIFLATQSGKLSIFEERVNQLPNNNNSKSRSHLQSHVRHKKTVNYKKARNISQMVVNLDKNLLILLMNNGHYLCMNALNLVEYTDKKNAIIPVSKTKNAERIIAHFKRPYYRFAICSKKNIYIFEWDKHTKTYLFVREISNGEQCISCLFYNHYLCFSTHKKGFVMHEIKSGKEKKINVPSMPNNIPRMYQISHTHDAYDYKEYQSETQKDDGYLLVQASTNLSIFIDKTGNPAQKDTVNWSSTPLFVVDCKTYMVGYLDNKCIEIISLVDQKAVQLLKIYNNNSYAMASASEQDTQCINGLYRTLSNHVILYDSTDVYSLVPTPIQQQISECIKHLRIEKGLKLLMNSEEPTQNELRSFQAEAGFALLCNLQWKRSMEHFEISDVDPRDIIYLFPKIKFAGFEYTIQHSSAPKNGVTIHDLIDKVLKCKRSQSNADNSMNDFSEEKKSEYLNGIYYLGQFLWKRRSDPHSEDLRIIGAETKLCVDTALLKIYVSLTDNRYNLINQDLTNSAPFEIEDLLDYECENACVESECEKILISSQQYLNLALFYRSKGKLAKSLNSLYKIGKTQEWKGDTDEAINLTISILSLMSDTQDLWTYAQWILELKAEFAMNIFTHSGRRQMNSKLYIAFDKVLTHLREDIIGNIDGYSEIDNFDYIQKYLEFIVKGSDNDSLNPKYHDELAYLYMKKIGKLNKFAAESESMYGEMLENIKQKLLEFLGRSQLISPSKLLLHAKNFQLYDEIIELNKKLSNHKAVLYTLVIDKKDHKSAIEYCKETAPSSKDRSDRFMELLRLYFGDRQVSDTVTEKKSKSEKMDKRELIRTAPTHLQNATINFELLKSELTAENDEFNFMTDKGNGNGNGGMNFDFEELGSDNDNGNHDVMPEMDENEIFNAPNINRRTKRRGAISIGSPTESGFDKSMIDAKEDSSFDKQEFFERGCDILYSYAFDMDYLKVLQLLPSSMEIMHFEKYIRKIVPYIVHKRRKTQIKKNLYKRQHMRRTMQLAKLQTVSVKMGFGSLCKKCHKNIGSSVFILDPKSMKKYHYSCFYKKRQPKHPNIITNQHYIDDLGNDIINDDDIHRFDIKRQNSNKNRVPIIKSLNSSLDIEPFNNPFANKNVSNDSMSAKIENNTNTFGMKTDTFVITEQKQETVNETNPFGSNTNNTNVNTGNNPFGTQNVNNASINKNETNPFFGTQNKQDKTNPFGSNAQQFEKSNPFS